MTDALHPRLHAVRPDLADIRLQGRVSAARFVEGDLRAVLAPSAPLRREGRPDAPLDTEAIRGDVVRVFDERDGWAWVQLQSDGYVGYLPAAALGPPAPAPTHRVIAVRAFIFPGPDLKLPPIGVLPFGARVTLGRAVVTRGTSYLLLDGGGALAARQVAPLDARRDEDFVAVAERFLGVPYLWGGRTSLGLDCSGLIQMAFAATGRMVLRDADMQEESVGVELPADADLRRGDLVFWPGHVGVLRDGQTLLHANAFHMEVASEPLAGAIERIAKAGYAISRVRRP